MELYSYYDNQSVNTTLSPFVAFILSVFVTTTTLLGIVHGKHTEKTPAQQSSYVVQQVMRTSRREDTL